MAKRASVLVFFLLCGLAAFAQASAPRPAAPKISGTPSLAAARSTVAKTVGGESFAIYLESYAIALPVHDAVTLCKEFLPKATSGQRPGLASFAGSLALIAGRYEEAGYFFAQGGAGSPELLLRASRCYLAAGKVDSARKQLDALAESEKGKAYEAERRLVLAWLYLLEAEQEKAFILLQPIAEGGETAERRSEALFLLWLAARSPEFSGFKVSTKGYDAKSIEARLAAEFPLSLALALVKDENLAAPAPWLLSVFVAAPSRAGSEHRLTTPVAAGAGAGSTGAQLQVGWFSHQENAAALRAKLEKLGFKASIETQKSKDGEARWAVIVDAAEDWSKTQVRLKDAGYESYLLP